MDKAANLIDISVWTRETPQTRFASRYPCGNRIDEGSDRHVCFALAALLQEARSREIPSVAGLQRNLWVPAMQPA
jgi:hypothetical protein